MPASFPGAHGYLQAMYSDASHENSLLCTTTEMLEDKDRENRALRMELFNARSDHWATLNRFAPAVQARYMDMRDLYPLLPPAVGTAGAAPPFLPDRTVDDVDNPDLGAAAMEDAAAGEGGEVGGTGLGA